MYVNDRFVKTDILGVLVKSPASSGIPQEGVDFPGVQFLGSTSRQKPSYRHPRARISMYYMLHVRTRTKLHVNLSINLLCVCVVGIQFTLYRYSCKF